MGGILNAIADYNPTGFVNKSRQDEANLAQTQAVTANQQLEQQKSQLAIAQAQRAAKDADLMRQATIESGGEPNKYRQTLIKLGASPTAILSFDEARAKTRYETSRADKETLAAEQEGHKMAQGALDAVLALPPDQQPQAWAQVAQGINQKFPGSNIPVQHPGPEMAPFYRNQLALGGALLSEANTQQELTNKVNTDARAAAAEGRAAEMQAPKVREALAQATSAEQKAAGTEPIQPAERLRQEFENQRQEERLLQQAKEAELSRNVTMRGQNMTDARSMNKPGQKPLPQPAIKTLETSAGSRDELDRLNGTFKDDFGGHPITGNLENWIGRIAGDPRNEGQAQWWQDYQSHKNNVRHGLFGGALTPGEQAEFDKQDISPSMSPKQIRDNLSRQKSTIDKALRRAASVYVKGGYNPDQISEYVNPVAGGGGQSQAGGLPAVGGTFNGGKVLKIEKIK